MVRNVEFMYILNRTILMATVVITNIDKQLFRKYFGDQVECHTLEPPGIQYNLDRQHWKTNIYKKM